MPNWCDNSIECDQSILEDICDREYVDEEGRRVEGFYLSKILPTPQEVEQHEMNVWRWRNENWGTTHEVLEVNKPNKGRLWFQTAWSPSIPAIQEMSNQFPSEEITLTFEGIDDDFAGHIKFKDGEIIERVEGTCAGYKLGQGQSLESILEFYRVSTQQVLEYYDGEYLEAFRLDNVSFKLESWAERNLRYKFRVLKDGYYGCSVLLLSNEEDVLAAILRFAEEIEDWE